MLKKFYCENYRNLEFALPLSFGSITAIYGICASGKSNLCRAIGDIMGAYLVDNVENDRDIFFYYMFSYGGEDVEIQYRKNNESYICFVRLFFVRLKADYISIAESREIWTHLDDIQKKMLESGNMYAISLLDKLRKEIKNIRIYMEGGFGALGRNCNLSMENPPANYMERMDDADREEDISMIICDDIDVQIDLTKYFMEKALISRIPIIYTTRRTELIEQWCGQIENCVLIHGGKVANAVAVSNKDLRTLKKLICFLKAHS